MGERVKLFVDERVRPLEGLAVTAGRGLEEGRQVAHEHVEADKDIGG